jgi:hypothetical protein
MIFFKHKNLLFFLSIISAQVLVAEVQDPVSQLSSSEEHSIVKVAENGLTEEQLAVLVSMKEAIEKQERQENKSFYSEYLARYYPRAMVIRNRFFTYAQPDQVLSALHDFCDLLADEPWFYFSNSPDGIVISRYWEYIVGQCNMISDYLEKAHVDLASKKVFLPKVASPPPVWGGWLGQMRAPVNQSSKPFFSYLNDEQKVVIHEFYALIFDYTIKLFNKAILFEELPQARNYLRELHLANQKLRNSIFEAKYLQAFKTSSDLLVLLGQKIARNEPDNDDELCCRGRGLIW